LATNEIAYHHIARLGNPQAIIPDRSVRQKNGKSGISRGLQVIRSVQKLSAQTEHTTRKTGLIDERFDWRSALFRKPIISIAARAYKMLQLLFF
jgi:hypothetical protein